MREILFRGKRKDNNEWVCGYLYRLSERLNPFIMFVNSNAESHEVIPETVSQFTGLTDRLGKKIFEGDIIAKGLEFFEVRWNPEQVRWSIYSDNYEVAGFTKFSEPYFEIIGNIHDNPNLLDEVEE